ncbi:tetratricopeptide repeat protein [Nitrospirillum pindoramense]|uniref:Tetratricopeptide repeat protein n=1 Tax=Nitrospirillum amazonense TaxID=28077 RepID=A0A560H3P9_9PROT|nr:tetratricopeptide repeat protein [Nitrospirillum amazonense]TWB40459.1 tetratricopeptide repeat protein [Nitrospirillum amazonense]
MPVIDLAPDPLLADALQEGLAALRGGNARLALDGYFNKIIAAYQARYRDIRERLYCARTQAEASRYLQEAAGRQQSVRIVEAGLVQAYAYRAYELMVLNDMSGAVESLERARDLSPGNADILSRLAVLYKARQKVPQALETYQAAVLAASELSPPDRRWEELHDAYHGLGGMFLAMGRLDEAAATYQQCLAALPDDDDANEELAYIRQRQRAQGH